MMFIQTDVVQFRCYSSLSTFQFIVRNEVRKISGIPILKAHNGNEIRRGDVSHYVRRHVCTSNDLRLEI